ncbi:hypothetical protein HKD28_00060 [Gluconobacter sp. LMG 1744]|uniref:DUF2798 domain-containing protein n=2 Tax=Gluconobacter TaxID=441 RepID=A0AAW3R072_9PROT|nr:MULTISPECIES: hypothetical protein [Gluconobacter]AQS90355.1 hypothetical protein A0U94_04550 [Gluconobacter albidus]KXV42117.1 hypothetical protein AD941_01800 [Gluconobacter albidus]MBF0889819.1 hypothetical protein [Gluconobacter cadivus]MBS1090607.1 hypothetical protein [Gluconobacter sp. Dm-74]MCP1235342.1 hypothetical protein [Gluconobacter kondonii]
MSVAPQSRSFFQQLREINGDRGFFANLACLFSVICMMGLSNLLSQSLLHQNMNWLLKPLMVVIALYFFVPYFLLRLTKRPSSEG